MGDNGAVKEIAKWGNIAGRETKGLFSASEAKFQDDYLVHAPVGEFQANAFGLLDVLGNVLEWTSTKSSPSNRVYRGGSFNDTAMFARVAYRDKFTAKLRSGNLGLRPSCRITH